MNMMTVAEVALAINVSESMVRKMISLEQLTPVRIGSKILFPKDYILEKFKLTEKKSLNDIDIDTFVNAFIEKLAGIELPGGVKLLFNPSEEGIKNDTFLK